MHVAPAQNLQLEAFCEPNQLQQLAIAHSTWKPFMVYVSRAIVVIVCNVDGPMVALFTIQI